MANKSSIDYLSSLPPELLMKVFGECGRLSGPLSKVLLPFTRAPIFKNVVIKTAKLFKLFIRTIEKDPYVGELVKTIKVIVDIKDVNVKVKKDQVLKVLKALPTVYHFETNWESLAAIITSEDIKKLDSLPQLRTLSLIDPFKSQKHPWSREHFRNLADHSNLITLKLDSKLKKKESSVYQVKERNLREETREIAVLGNDSKGHDFNNNNVTEVDIGSYLDDPYLIDTILSFKATTILRISADVVVDGQGILAVLEGINADIIELHIYDPPDYSYYYGNQLSRVIVPIYPAITRFTKLRKLTISNPVFSSDIFQYLRDPLPLESLTFGLDCTVDISDLKQLLLPGLAKLSGLKNLILDVVEGQIGATDNPLYDKYEGGYIPDSEDWILPDWRAGKFDEEGLEEFISLADETITNDEDGIELDGSALHALNVQEEWNEQVDIARNMGQDDADEWYR